MMTTGLERRIADQRRALRRAQRPARSTEVRMLVTLRRYRALTFDELRQSVGVRPARAALAIARLVLGRRVRLAGRYWMLARVGR